MLMHFYPQVTLAAWQEFDSQQEAVHEFVNKTQSTIERDLSFSSPESLAVELDQTRVRSNVSVFNVFIFCCFILPTEYSSIVLSTLSTWRMLSSLFIF